MISRAASLDALSRDLKQEVLAAFPELEPAPGKIVYPKQYSGLMPEWSYQTFPPDEEEAQAIFSELDDLVETWVRLHRITREKPFGGQYYTCWKPGEFLILITNPSFELGPVRISWISKMLNAKYLLAF